jgi:hypothetical protein
MTCNDKGAAKEGAGDVSFMIKAMQQQFERMNTRFDDMRERMEEQANTIAELQRRHEECEAPRAKRQLRRAH